MRKKILFVENSVSHMSPGGSHKSLINLVKNLDPNTYKPYILLNRKNELISKLFDLKNIKVFYLNHQTIDTNQNSKFGFYKEENKSRNKLVKKIRNIIGIYYRILFDIFPMMLKTIKLIRQLKIDIVHTNTRIGSNQFAILAAWIFSIPIVSHERWWTKSNFLNVFVSSLPDSIVCVSSAIKSNLISLGVDKNKCNVIFNGRNIQNINNNYKKYENYKSNEFNIGMMANISEYKGHTIFVQSAIRLLKKYENMRFYIYGSTDSPQKEYLDLLTKIIHDAGQKDKIILKGYIENVDNIFNSLHINCCLTLGEEPLSGTIIEGFINNTAVVATRTGGSPELIKNKETGLLIEPNSVEDFVLGVESLYNNERLLKRITKNANNYAKTYLSNEVYVKNISNIYSSLFGK